MPSPRAQRIEDLLDVEDKKSNLDPGHMQRETQLEGALAQEDPQESSAYEEERAHRKGKSNPMRHIGRMKYFA